MALTHIDNLPNELLCKIWSRLTPDDQVMLKATKNMYNKELKRLGIDFSNFIRCFTKIAAATDAPAKTTDAPAETTDAPAKTTDAPAKTTDAPAETKITFYNDKYTADTHTPFMYITFNNGYITFDVILPDSLDTFKNTLAHKLELKWFNPDKEDCFSLKIFHQGCEQIANDTLDSKVPPETTIYKFIVADEFYHVDETTAELVKSTYKPDELVNYNGPCTGYPYVIKKKRDYYLRKWCAKSIDIETNITPGDAPKLHVLHEIALIFYRFKNGIWSSKVSDEKLKTALKTFTDTLNGGVMRSI